MKSVDEDRVKIGIAILIATILSVIVVGVIIGIIFSIPSSKKTESISNSQTFEVSNQSIEIQALLHRL